MWAKKVRRTELGTETVCKNCGKAWLEHYFEFCDKDGGSIDKKTPMSELFVPVGVEFDSICDKCAEPLYKHYKHIFCGKKSKKSGWQRFRPSMEKKSFIPEELFEI
jgi:hypothetical protein